MKRFSIFCAALFAAVTSFAAVSYELNGGVQSEWENPQAMYNELNAIWNTFSGATTEWGDLATLKADVAKGIPTAAGSMALTFIEDATFKAKFEWLVTYMDAKCAEQGQTLPSTDASFLRYNLQAFFIDGVRASWPKSANYAACGVSTLDAYQPYWKSSFANPTAPTAEVALYAPYKEGETFLGWYWNADFSGEKVTKIDASSTGTLYAKFGTYIPTVAEVRALADATETKVTGVVNCIDGNNLYIQDATGGVLVATTAAPTCKVGEKIVAKGVTGTIAGAPAVKDAAVESVEAGTAFPVVAFESLAELVADSVAHKHFATNVSVPGVTIVELDANKCPTVQDAAGNKALCYNMPVTFAVGTKVTVTAVAGWNNVFQFVGDAKGIVKPIAGKKEQYTYPERSNGRYSLENNWVISNVEDNYAANKPGATDYVRGMAAKDGIMYFINRDTKQIVRVDGESGNMLDPIVLQGTDSLYKVASTDSTGAPIWAATPGLAYNDIKFDQAGNCLIGGQIEISASSKECQPFFIYMVDLETGECKELIKDVLWDNPGLSGITFRFDAFGVAGDVTKNGVIMAADRDSWNVYRWLITDGVASEGEQVAVLLDPAVDQSLYISAGSYGTAPQIFPQDEVGSLFYVDGFNMLPMLFYGTPEEGAILLDDFINVPAGTKVTNNEGEVLSMNTGHNGLIEFQVGEEYFLLIAASNTAITPPSAFALYKFADADRAFSGMTPLWFFPHNGLGTATNGCRTAVPSVDVVSDTEATLYIYANNNGYAAYTLTIDPSIADNTAVEDIETVKVGAEKVIENGQIFILKNGVKYNALGAQVK